MHASNRYADIRAKAARVRERALFVSPRIPNELELQARWFAGDFGRHFVSTTGDKIDIVQFGTWNREAGPDFRDAAIRINGSDPIRGCIELDVTDRSWEAHGHATNPAFEETVLHIFVEKSGRELFTRNDRIAMSRKSASISQLCRMRLARISRWRDRAVVRHRSRICLKSASRACWMRRRSSACGKRPLEFAARSTAMAAMKRSFRKSRQRSVTRKTNCRLH